MAVMETFVCQDCGDRFRLSREILDRYPGWTPSKCLRCRDAKAGAEKVGKPAPKKRSPRKKSASRELNLTLSQVRERFSEGPQTGVFTDGACSGNPGPGGWGMVWVEAGEVREQKHGSSPETTNNRMELQALIEAYRSLPADAQVTIFSDSQLCVKTVNEWAAGWQRRGWKRKTGPIANLDLVRPLYELALAHPKTELRWIAAHDGSLWNEYADSLATAYLRDEL